MSNVKISRIGFRCAYCGEKKKGAYRIVDGLHSCEKCNRAYNYIPSKPEKVICPICKGLGYIE